MLVHVVDDFDVMTCCLISGIMNDEWYDIQRDHAVIQTATFRLSSRTSDGGGDHAVIYTPTSALGSGRSDDGDDQGKKRAPVLSESQESFRAAWSDGSWRNLEIAIYKSGKFLNSYGNVGVRLSKTIGD